MKAVTVKVAEQDLLVLQGLLGFFCPLSFLSSPDSSTLIFPGELPFGGSADMTWETQIASPVLAEVRRDNGPSVLSVIDSDMIM